METFHYDNKIVRNFGIATVIWGLIGFLVGLIVALKLVYPDFLGFIPELSFGRLRPLHTNAVIFAFAGNAIFYGVYYSLPRLCKTPMASPTLSKINFWGWQLIILSAVLTLPFGITTSKEYAELEWPIDVAITLIWVVFGINMIWTILKRRERHIYVAIWFYIATFVTVAVLHLVNSFEMPATLLKSYPVYAGVQDALVQWWYGHNAVAFFLTTPFLGIMYYFIPKASQRPIYSYRLSIVHFWALIFIYIWAGPHHLLYTALPGWAQSLGTVFSLMLIAPSWGGMLNGLLTLRGAWDRVREDPVLKFMVVGVTAYGMSTFEGPMMSIANVNAITHYTDYVIAHVHVAALLWNGGLTFGMLYYITPRIFNTNIYSMKMANFHFWAATLGAIFYVIPIYWAGIAQSLMWKEFTSEGTLQYVNFLETVTQIIPMYAVRVFGGALFIVGAAVAMYNLYRTATSGSLIEYEEDEAPAAIQTVNENESWHRKLEGRPIKFTVLTTIAILIGGIVEYVPTAVIDSNIPTIASVQPYTPLEVEGRDIYIAEGCNNCHSQMIRPFRSETARYGEYSKAGEYVYDHPFLWGSKRTGPDLHRVGGKYPDSWHLRHMWDPTSTSPGSIMPAYTWLIEEEMDLETLPNRISALRSVGVPYADDYEKRAVDHAKQQAREIAQSLKEAGFNNVSGIEITSDKKIIAMIAYLQRLGVDIKGENDPFAKFDGPVLKKEKGALNDSESTASN